MVTEIAFSPLTLDQSDVRYLHGPDSSVQQGVPSGAVTEFEWNESSTYPGTSRRFWVYVPAQYDPTEAASLVVFQDGEYFQDPTGEIRAPIVLDNLIHRGDVPATIGVFVDPGVVADVEDRGRRNRNAEYDAFDDRYASFLVEEIIPEVTRHWSITDDPDRRAICGFSSGGKLRVHRGVAAPGRLPTCHLRAVQLRPDARGQPLPGAHRPHPPPAAEDLLAGRPP